MRSVIPIRHHEPKGIEMAILDAIIGPLGSILDKIIPDPRARDEAKLELLKLQGSQDLVIWN
jgi:hypothetical protein